MEACCSQISSPRIISISNNTGMTSEHWGNATLAGLVSVAQKLFMSVVAVDRPQLNSSVQTLLFGDASTPLASLIENNEYLCPSYDDPAPIILQSINQLMLRAGVQAVRMFNSSQLLQSLDPGLEVDSIVLGKLGYLSNSRNAKTSHKMLPIVYTLPIAAYRCAFAEHGQKPCCSASVL